MYLGMECRETLKLAHTKANILYAERLRGEILNAIEKKTFDYGKYFPGSGQLAKLGITMSADRITVGELVLQQMAQYERVLAPSTFKNYSAVRDAPQRIRQHDPVRADAG